MQTKIQNISLYLLLLIMALNGGLHFIGILAPIELKLNASQFAAYWQATDAYMGKRMPFFGLTTYALFIINLIVFRKYWRKPLFWIIAICMICMVVELVFTIKEQLPINEFIQTIDMNNLNSDQLVKLDKMRMDTYHNFNFRNYLAVILLMAMCLTPFLLPRLQDKNE
jgi:hypothetical protein